MECEYYKQLLKGQNSSLKIVQDFVEDLFEMNKSQIGLEMSNRVKLGGQVSSMSIEEKMKFFRLHTPHQSKKIQMKVEAMLKNMCDCQAPDNVRVSANCSNFWTSWKKDLLKFLSFVCFSQDGWQAGNGEWPTEDGEEFVEGLIDTFNQKMTVNDN